jgi:hypothetical protein
LLDNILNVKSLNFLSIHSKDGGWDTQEVYIFNAVHRVAYGMKKKIQNAALY